MVAGEWVEATTMATSSPKASKVPNSPISQVLESSSSRAHPVEAPTTPEVNIPDGPAEGKVPGAMAPTTAEVPPGEPPDTHEVNVHTSPAEGEAPEAMAHKAAEVPPGRSPAHTILMFQPDDRPETRNNNDHESVNGYMEDVCKIYGEHPRTTFPNIPSVWGSRHLIPSFTYDFTQSFKSIDQLVHRSCIIYQRTINTLQQGLEQREDPPRYERHT